MLMAHVYISCVQCSLFDNAYSLLLVFVIVRFYSNMSWRSFYCECCSYLHDRVQWKLC